MASITRLSAPQTTVTPTRSLVRGPAGSPGGSDASFAEWLADAESLTYAALHAQLDPAGAATSRLLGKLRADQGDASLVFVGDSSLAIYGTPTPDRIAGALGDEFPSYTVKIARWNDTNTYTPVPGEYGDPETLRTGTGDNTLWVYNGGAGSTNLHFPLTQLGALVVVPQPDLVVIDYGGNQGPLTSTNTADAFRASYLCLTESIREAVPTASLLCISQHPSDAGGLFDSYVAADMIREVCEARGYGYVNMTQVFHDLGGDAGDYLEDGVHPNDAGQVLWFDTIWRRAFHRNVLAPAAQMPSSFIYPAGRDLLNNGLFAAFDGSTAPTGWVAANVTLAKDAVNTEGSNGNGYSVKMTSTGVGSGGFLSQSVGALLLARLKGKYVTLTARVRADTPSASSSSNRGGVFLYDGVTFAQGVPDIWSDDQFVYHAITLRVDEAANQVTCALVCDNDADAVGTVNQWEWACLVEGVLPTIPNIVAGSLVAHTVDTTAAHAASAIAFTPTGTIAATDVQAAIAEVASEAGGGGSVPSATTSVEGIVELATGAETTTGTDGTRAVTPLGLADVVDAIQTLLDGKQAAGSYALSSEVASFPTICKWVDPDWKTLAGDAVPTDVDLVRWYDSTPYDTVDVTVPTHYSLLDKWYQKPVA